MNKNGFPARAVVIALDCTVLLSEQSSMYEKKYTSLHLRLYGFLFTQREQDYVKSRVICFLFTLIFNV